MRTATLVLVPLAALAPELAEACSCAWTTTITQPSGSTIPADGRLLGRAAGSFSTVELSYADDGTPVPGTVTVLGVTGSSTIWTFVPTTTLSEGRPVHAEVRSLSGMPQASADFRVVAAAVPGPPTFGGVTAVRAFKSRLHIRSGDSCSPQEGAVQDRLELTDLPAPSASAPIYRYYFYDTPGAQPSTPSAVGIEGHYLSSMRCGNAELLCEPWTWLNLTAGQTFCVRVEAEDLAGRRSGYGAEACTTVVEEEVDYWTQFPRGYCTPRVEPGGAEGTAQTSLDGGAAGAGAEVEAGRGCRCLATDSSGPLAGLVWAVALGLALRRRERMGRVVRGGPGLAPDGAP